MNMTGTQLRTHLNMRHSRHRLAQFKFNTEGGANPHAEYKASNSANDAQMEAVEDGVILDCEIPTTAPSVNHYWIAVGKRRFLSDKAKNFHRIIRALVPAHRSASRLKLDVTFHFPNKQRRDIDNYLKATIDSLVKCGLCVDDEQFDELLVRRGRIIKGGLIRLKVTEV